MKIKGKVKKIFYSSDGYSIFNVEMNGSMFKCVGAAYNLKEGANVEIDATEKLDIKWGLQFEINEFKHSCPDSEQGLIAFLSSGLIKGVGEGIAKRIVAKFGTDTMTVIKENPEKLKTVNGISERKLKTIVESLAEYTDYEEVYRICNGFVTPNEASKIIKTFGKKAAGILKNNPYQLLSISGFGFLKVDKIAMATGIAELSKPRASAAIDYVLEGLAEQQGDCFVTIETMEQTAISVLHPFPKAADAVRGLRKHLEGILDDYSAGRDEFCRKFKLQPDILSQIDAWVEKREKYLDLLASSLNDSIAADKIMLILPEGFIACKKYYDAEDFAADKINAIKGKKPLVSDINAVQHLLDSYEAEYGIKLTERQRDGVVRAVTNRISLLTGGPGTGKTTVIQAIRYCWNKLVSDSVILCAPTGRAAQRIKETITDAEASSGTVHKITGMGKLPPAVDPQEDSLIIVDESSMLNLEHAVHLLEYAENSSIVFVGDEHQLPPIGAGLFFADMIRSGSIITTILTTGFRNPGPIAVNAGLINDGNTHLTSSQDFTIMDFEERELIPEKVRKMYLDEISKGIKPSEICILTLQRQRGAVSVAALNKIIQDSYNPVTGNNSMPDCGFRIGDRVMHIHNDYHMEYVLNGTVSTGVFNGDLGIVTGLNSADEQVQVTFDDGRIATYEKADLTSLTLAYAMTVHKSQGSEFKRCFLCVTMDQYTLLSRSVVYTAVTRAKKEITVCCERKALNLAIRTVDNKIRNTRLKGLLR